ncbi:MAG: sugar phosphate nucleotidyltransferase [Acidobacteriota bacterium]|jgi:mannose-1-phosphate guanylyltransferase
MSVSYIVNERIHAEDAEFVPLPRTSRHLWAIILAGGNGERIHSLTNRWKGRHVPKQYCAFVGSRSMLQHTLDRADVLVEPEHQRILIARAHQHQARSQLADDWPGRIIVQPENRDTFPGIFLPLTHIYSQDVKATVIIYPSDHFIYPKKRFAHVVAGAVRAVEDLPERLLLIGAPADSPEQDYGWIYPGSEIWRSGKYSAYAVKRFLEKPLKRDAVDAMTRGGLWNTLIIVVKAHTLWQLGWNYFPETMYLFVRLFKAVGSCRESDVLESIYKVMPSQNFSTGFLTLATNHIGVMPMNDVLWSDWGSEKRIVETLVNMGKQPNFPYALPTLNRQTAHGTKFVSSSLNSHA